MTLQNTKHLDQWETRYAVVLVGRSLCKKLSVLDSPLDVPEPKQGNGKCSEEMVALTHITQHNLLLLCTQIVDCQQIWYCLPLTQGLGTCLWKPQFGDEPKHSEVHETPAETESTSTQGNNVTWWSLTIMQKFNIIMQNCQIQAYLIFTHNFIYCLQTNCYCVLAHKVDFECMLVIGQLKHPLSDVPLAYTSITCAYIF